MRSVLYLQIEFERVGDPNRDGAYKIVSSMAYLKLIATKVDCYTPAGPGMVMICSVCPCLDQHLKYGRHSCLLSGGLKIMRGN